MIRFYTAGTAATLESKGVVEETASGFENESLLHATGLLRACLLDFAPERHWNAIGQSEMVSSFMSGKHLYLDRPLTKTRFLNTFLGSTRKVLTEGQYFAFAAVTAENIKSIFRTEYPDWLFKIYYPFLFFTRRVFPKLKGFRRLCHKLGIKADMSKSEIMGRLIYHGFGIAQIREDMESTVFMVQINPASNPSSYAPPSAEGFLFLMRRIGMHEKPVTIYKFRSMHPYSEFIQPYLYQTNGLDEAGKFRNDFRVSTGGRLIRKYWIDEIPMIYNLIRGDIKLVGVRPISAHYLSLYPEDIRLMRSQCKPGLLPPFYADLPGSFDEILQSERAYIESYSKNPLKTDWIYFWRIVLNITIRSARSR